MDRSPSVALPSIHRTAVRLESADGYDEGEVLDMPVNKPGSVTDAGATSGGCCGDAPATGGTAAADRCCETKSSSCCEPSSDCCDVKLNPDEDEGPSARTLPAFVNGSPAVASPLDVPAGSPIESQEERRKRLQAQQLV